MASVYRDILRDKPSSLGFVGLLSFVCFQPRKFFRILDKTPMKHSLLLAALIMGLLSMSAIMQADLSMSGDVYGYEDEYYPEDEFAETPLTSSGDPSESWIIGMTALGKQAIYWLVLGIVLSEVSLFKGKAPSFERNLQIAIWSSLPFGIMAILQILFLTGGGIINQPGFTGFLNEWQGYYELHPYLQSFVYALAAQFTFFNLWSFALLYKGARETLRGNRLVVAFVLFSWLTMLSLAYGYEHYQNGDAGTYFEEYEQLPSEYEPLYPETENAMYDEDYP